MICLRMINVKVTIMYKKIDCSFTFCDAILTYLLFLCKIKLV